MILRSFGATLLHKFTIKTAPGPPQTPNLDLFPGVPGFSIGNGFSVYIMIWISARVSRVWPRQIADRSKSRGHTGHTREAHCGREAPTDSDGGSHGLHRGEHFVVFLIELLANY